MNTDAMKKRIIITTMLGAFWVPFIATSVNVALPAIAKEFDASPSILGWIISSSLLATAMFVLPIGKLSDVYGRKNMMLLGTILLTLTSLLCGLSHSITTLIILRSIQGIGGAMMAATVVSIVTSAFPPGERGKALGINVAFTYFGLSASPFISGIIVNNFNWRGIFYFSIPIGLVLLVMILMIDQEWKEDDNKTIDYPGSLIYAAAVFFLIWGLSNFNSSGYGKVAFSAGILMLVLFGIFEMKTDYPLLDLRALKSNKVLIFSSVASFINYGSTFSISFMMSLYLQYIKGFDPQYTGMILLIQPAIQAVFSPVSGVLSDRMDPQYVASAGMALISVSLFFLSMLGMDTPTYLIVILLMVIGAGFALFASPNTNSIMSSVERKNYGVAAGILSTARTVGQTFSMATTALITSFYFGNMKISAQTGGLFIQSFKTTFIIFAGLCLLGIWASLARGKRENTDTTF